MSPTTPYQDTSVSVARSKEQISKILRTAGARAMQMEEEWDNDGVVESCLIRFMWMTEAGHLARVRFTAKPLAPEEGRYGGWKVSPEQRERQCWRGLAWYIESLTKAATFGFVHFEEVFLPYFEDDQGRTIGEVLVPQIQQGRLTLPKGAS
jgi:hypothetical protein